MGTVYDSRLAAQVRENTSPSELIQLSNERGEWIYRSPVMTRAGIGVEPVDVAAFRYADAVTAAGRLRVVTADVQIGTPHYRMQMAESLARYDRARRRLWWAMLVSVPLLLLLSASGAYWLTARALAPIDAIAQEHARSQIKILTSAFLFHRLTTRCDGWLRRSTGCSCASRAFQRIKQFTADASHELRAPLAVIRTTAEIGGRRSRSEEEYRQHLAEIVTETDNTAKLVESLLAIARADSGASLRSETVDVAEITEVCGSARRIAQEKGFALAATIQPGPLRMTGDAEAIRRLLVAVIDNAVKYTQRGVVRWSECKHQ